MRKIILSISHLVIVVASFPFVIVVYIIAWISGDYWDQKIIRKFWRQTHE